MMGILSVLLLAVLLTTFAMEALLLWFHTERNRLQMTLLCVVIFWFAIFLDMEIGLIRACFGKGIPVSGVLNFHNIVLGYCGFFSWLCYPAMTLHPRLLSVRNVLQWLSPVLLLIAIYVAWHIATGTPMNYRYLTISELWAHRWTVPVILRVLMLFTFIVYQFGVFIYFRQLIALYNRHSEDNYSDIAYNVRWLQMIIWAIISISVTYTTLVFWKHPISSLAYVIVIGGAMVKLTVNAAFHRLFTHNHELMPHWSFKGGWQLSKSQSSKADRENDYKKRIIQLDQWMNEKRHYLNPDFSAKIIYNDFPELTGKLTVLLGQRNHTFQSYVREYRIKEACRLMIEDPRLNNKELAYMVGFTIASSFNRAFVAVMNTTPQNYKKEHSAEQYS